MPHTTEHMRGVRWRALLFYVSPVLLTGCAVLPSSGPSTGAVNSASQGAVADAPVHVVDLTTDVAIKLKALEDRSSLADDLGDGVLAGAIVGRGDALNVSVWEAPPAVLFAPSNAVSRREPDSGSATVSTSSQLPEQVVDQDGTIRIPFIGLFPQQDGVLSRLEAKSARVLRARLMIHRSLCK